MTEKDFYQNLIGKDVRAIMINGYNECGLLLAVDDEVIFISGEQKDGKTIMLYKRHISGFMLNTKPKEKGRRY